MKSKLILVIGFVVLVVLLGLAYAVHSFYVAFGPRLDSPYGYQRLQAVNSPKLTDQATLARMATTDEMPMVRSAAIEKLTDQNLLSQIALDSNSVYGFKSVKRSPFMGSDKEIEEWATLRAAAVAKLTNETLLAQIVLGEKHYKLRSAAAQRLTSQALLARVAVEDQSSDVRDAAGQRLDVKAAGNIPLLMKVEKKHESALVRAGAMARTRPQAPRNQIELMKAAEQEKDPSVRCAAVWKIHDPKLLTKVLVNRHNDPAVRAVALLGISHDELVFAVARAEPDLTVRTTAILLLDSQSELQRLASQDPIPLVREIAIGEVSSDDFLLSRTREEASPTIAVVAVQTLHEASSILTAATGSYYGAARGAARERLLQLGNQDALKKALASARQIDEEVAAITSTTESELARMAVQGRFDVVCRASAARIREPSNLKRVILETKDREVVKIALNRLEDIPTLREIGNTRNRDFAINLAALYKAGVKSWDDIFRDAGTDPVALGDALAAVSLFNTVQLYAKAAVEQSCVQLIRLGNEARIPEMIELLETFGSKELAEDYLNCGQQSLVNAARSWAAKRGYTITEGSASSRAKWGSK